MSRGSAASMRRAMFAAMLTAIGLIMSVGPPAGSESAGCAAAGCGAAGRVLWARLLPGTWVAASGVAGTIPAAGQAYAAMSGKVAAVGVGMTVSAFGARTGLPLWTRPLAGFPAGSRIVSVRAWSGVISVGVQRPAAGSADGSWAEVVLRAAGGQQVRAFPSAAFGGAVAANAARTVVVGPHAVTSYLNRTGRVAWRRPTGRAAQAWQSDGGHVYVTVAAGGYLGTAPVRALRRISLRTGAEDFVAPRVGTFAGALSLVFHGVAVFTGPGGVTAYDALTGQPLWQHPGVLTEGTDPVAGRIYLIAGNALIGVDPRTGNTEARVPVVAVAASSGLYGVRDGAVLGLDHGALGNAWGYAVSTKRVLWTSGPLPWPHYFVDPSGIGGSTSPGHGPVLLAICAQLAARTAGSAGQECARPELVSLSR